jgi:Putative transcriptional regulator
LQAASLVLPAHRFVFKQLLTRVRLRVLGAWEIPVITRRSGFAALFLSILLIAFGTGLYLEACGAMQGATARPTASLELSKGLFLVAARGMPDPRFRHAVILLIEHGAQGTLGLIINKATNVFLAEAVPNLKGVEKREHRLFYGGPVATNLLAFLVRNESALENAHPVTADIHFSTNRNILEQMLARGKSAEELRVYIGYAGWAPGQLHYEMERRDWHLLPAERKTIFKVDPDTIWPELIEQGEPSGLMAKPWHLRPPLLRSVRAEISEAVLKTAALGITGLLAGCTLQGLKILMYSSVHAGVRPLAPCRLQALQAASLVLPAPATFLKQLLKPAPWARARFLHPLSACAVLS